MSPTPQPQTSQCPLGPAGTSASLIRSRVLVPCDKAAWNLDPEAPS